MEKKNGRKPSPESARLAMRLKEACRRILDEELDKMLSETSVPRKRFLARTEGLLPQIATAWCPVRYCALTGRTRLKKHWTDDKLKAHLENLTALRISGGDSPKSRAAAFAEAAERLGLDDPAEVLDAISGKFEGDRIDPDEPEVAEAARQFSDDLPQIAVLVGEGGEDDVAEYSECVGDPGYETGESVPAKYGRMFE